MSEQHDDPLRSTAPYASHSSGQQGELVSPTSAASPSAPFMTSSSGRDFGTAGRQQSGPKSAYYKGPPDQNSAFGTPPVGVIGRGQPREIVRIERDYSGGELCQFHPTFPLELEGRISPTTFSETINDINVLIIEANDSAWACLDNTLAVLSLYTSSLLLGSKYRREMKKLDKRIDEANKNNFNPAGLNLRNPFETAFLFMELEYF